MARRNHRRILRARAAVVLAAAFASAAGGMAWAPSTAGEVGKNAAPGFLVIAPPDDVIIKFDTPIDLPSDPIDGRSLRELIAARPTYSPVEGLARSTWAQPCSSCHEWTKDSLCAQAKNYEGAGQALMARLAHPFGLPFKYILMRWATTGCQ